MAVPVPKKRYLVVGVGFACVVAGIVWFRLLPVPTLPPTFLTPAQRAVLHVQYGKEEAQESLVSTLFHASKMQLSISIGRGRTRRLCGSGITGRVRGRVLNHARAFEIASRQERRNERNLSYLRRALIAYKVQRKYPDDVILASVVASRIGPLPSDPGCLAGKLAERLPRGASPLVPLSFSLSNLLRLHKKTNAGFSMESARTCLLEKRNAFRQKRDERASATE